MKRIYRTMQGREIDMDQLIAKNETMPAIGNVRMNARGDELGPTGEIIRTKEEKINEYYSGTSNIEQVKINSNRKTFTDSKLERVPEEVDTPIISTKKEPINDSKRKDIPAEG